MLWGGGWAGKNLHSVPPKRQREMKEFGFFQMSEMRHFRSKAQPPYLTENIFSLSGIYTFWVKGQLQREKLL